MEEKQEEHRQLQSDMHFTQKQYLVGPYYANLITLKGLA